MKKIISSLFAIVLFSLAAQTVFAENFSCGSGYANDRTDAVCDPSCPANGSYTDPTDNTIKTCCGWVFDGTCRDKETFACGQSWEASRSNATCAPACPANGTFVRNNIVRACCGYVYNNDCHPSPAQTISCGSGYANDRTDAVCTSSCPANGTYTDPADNTIKTCCGWVFEGICRPAPMYATCGNVYYSSVQCPASCPASEFTSPGGPPGICCGWKNSQGVCVETPPQGEPGGEDVFCGTKMSSQETIGKSCRCKTGFQPNGNEACCGWWSADKSQCLSAQPNPPGGNPGDGVTTETFAAFNRAIFGASGPDSQLTTPRGIISKLLPYLFTFGGLILFVMILWGGFEMLTGAANPKSQEAGKQRITAAVIGFLLLFSSYWLAQIVQAVFGISILSN